MKKTISIIGGGASSFLLAAFLDIEKFDITIYEKNKTAGRKFLVAGKGGFNLTHSETIEQLIKRYTANNFLENSLHQFTNTDFRNWLEQIGIPTYIGSSKRVYPIAGIKPIEVLNAMLKHLEEKGVRINYNQTFSDWDDNKNPIINSKTIQAEYTVFCLGGGSWKITGSDGTWLDTFSEKGIKTKAFQASNCGYQIDWESNFIQKHEGIPLKNIAISCNNVVQKGEAVITTFGLEGNAIYGLSPQIRKQLNVNSKATIFIDFKPSLTVENILLKIKVSSYKNTTQILKKELKLTAAQIDLLKTNLSKESYLNPKSLSENIKRFPLEIINTATIDEAISTVGGIDLNSISENFELKKMPNQYCIGEMLDWDAPTGGYLLQACASIGVYLANHLNNHSN
ncbi:MULTISPECIES: NAD(P)/FAD-dependent oxidoreductase [unclassified Polaribacter]|uniref:NAD(P)/FAD-dependent oxidoreductase n=1 Tax=unclassified Polaribacter TaxID=196858 RepID=UPI0011BDB576|nr:MULTISPECIES: NAD(P)-dependent oxidoreductase [unclassified Polaribacter]TXD53946.1 TIGR03862 family flavoprotein [Polaribacter sp. IC063]TXD59655.1 TIGR03862 family flavoprotein [Polaribacter sp. IC066]